MATTKKFNINSGDWTVFSQRNRGNILAAKNSKAVKEFLSDVKAVMHGFSRSTITQAGRIGLRKLVNRAGFNDYTGKMINSYQAAILTKGGIEERIAKQTSAGRTVTFNNLGSNATRVNSKIPILMTSYGLPGTIEISHKSTKYTNSKGEEYKGPKIRNRRDGGESPEVRRWGQINNGPESKFPKGFGHVITHLKGIAPPIKSGYWLVFGNGASGGYSTVWDKDGGVGYAWPLAEHVHTQHKIHQGIQHKVFPDGDSVDIFGIGQQELKRALASMKRYYKR